MIDDPIVISGTGVYTPPEIITNEELVASFNEYVRRHNATHAEKLAESSSEFIVKASGIRRRHVMNKSGILDVDIMKPQLPKRANDELSIQAEIAVKAAREALARANKTAEEIDAVYVACSNMQRAYPAVAIEVQQALGIQGYAFDLNVACSSATFGLQTAMNALSMGSAQAVLVINPEICTAHVNFRDRDSHFIFGDACSAVVVERKSTCKAKHAFAMLSTKLLTQFSNNIRNNAGFLNRTEQDSIYERDRLFMQQGRAVFKEVVPMVAKLMTGHLQENNIAPEQLKRLWLHQANLSMDHLIAEKVLGRATNSTETPVILDEYANTSSAGSIIAFHLHHEDLVSGDLGVLCSFGAGYSIGCILLKKL